MTYCHRVVFNNSLKINKQGVSWGLCGPRPSGSLKGRQKKKRKERKGKEKVRGKEGKKGKKKESDITTLRIRRNSSTSRGARRGSREENFRGTE